MKTLALTLVAISTAAAQQYTISTVAGGALPQTPIAGVQASLRFPQSVALDVAGNVYFAAFKKHIGLYPPVRGADKKLMRLKKPFEGPKGNLIFPLDQPIPYALIASIARFQAQQNLAKAAAEGKARGKSRTS